jgi:hypothetical protein
MRKTRKRVLHMIGQLIFGVAPHQGAWHRGGRYSPNKQRQLRKSFLRARQRGVPVRRAMTDAVLEVGDYV